MPCCYSSHTRIVLNILFWHVVHTILNFVYTQKNHFRWCLVIPFKNAMPSCIQEGALTRTFKNATRAILHVNMHRHPPKHNMKSAFVDHQRPTVTFCPSDMTVRATGRTANARWRQPRFREPFDYRLTYPANRATLTWGSHRITCSVISSNNGRDVTCSFTVNVEREQCSTVDATVRSSYILNRNQESFICQETIISTKSKST